MADDNESLDEILSGNAPQPETAEQQQPEPEAETANQPRDDHGRFAPKAGEGEPEVAEPDGPEAEQPEADHDAPVGALVAERRKRQAAEERASKLDRDMAEMRGQMSVLMQRVNQPAQQPQPEPVKPPNWYEDPEAAINHALTPIQQASRENTLFLSQQLAEIRFGEDKVSEAQNALKAAIESGSEDGRAWVAKLSNSRHPVGDIVKWHQNSPAVQQATMREQLRAELMAEFGIDPNAPKPVVQPRTQTPNIKLPPSLSKIPAGHTVAERDESLEEILAAPRR